MEPAERQEKIPTESQKEKEGVRKIARGMKAHCGLEGNYCGAKGWGGVGGLQEERGRRRDRSEETAANEREKERVAITLPRPRREREERESLG